jgi:hypothetical protein
VFPDTTLSRGGIPSSIWRNRVIAERFRTAAPRAFERRVIEAGYVAGGVTAPFRPVWNRSRFQAVKRLVSIPVLAVGGIRTGAEINDIVDSGDADLAGIGRPFYAEADLAARILGGDMAPARCRNSNLCVPAQMLGMKGVCYNPQVKRVPRGASTGRLDRARAEALDGGEGEG